MAINKSNIIVLDFETGNSDPYDCIPLELAAIVVDPQTLKPVPGATFETLIKPWCGWDKVSEDALKVNKIDPKEVDKKGLEENIAFDLFAKFVKSYSNGKGNNKWTNPIIAGHNISSFDKIIMDKLCVKYGYVDKDGRPKLFHPFNLFDTISICLLWFENEPEPAKYSLDYLRTFFGISTEGSHRALKDVEDCAEIMCRFINFSRAINKKNKPKFKGAFSQ